MLMRDFELNLSDDAEITNRNNKVKKKWASETF